jgi:hypothetical protein
MTRYESPSNGHKASARLGRYAAHEGGPAPHQHTLRGASLKRCTPPRSMPRLASRPAGGVTLVQCAVSYWLPPVVMSCKRLPHFLLSPPGVCSSGRADLHTMGNGIMDPNKFEQRPEQRGDRLSHRRSRRRRPRLIIRLSIVAIILAVIFLTVLVLLIGALFLR